jgi:hypothetical protein
MIKRKQLAKGGARLAADPERDLAIGRAGTVIG